jgi:ubiquinol-cytochrome c reductase iron-sulfur subunit
VEPESSNIDLERRRALTLAASAAGGAATAALAWPFLASMAPSERARALGAPVEADISNMKRGDLMTVEWQGKPVWMLRRTDEMIETLGKHHELLADPESHRSIQPEYCRNPQRSIKPEVFVRSRCARTSGASRATAPRATRPRTSHTPASTARATARSSTRRRGSIRTCRRRPIS